MFETDRNTDRNRRCTFVFVFYFILFILPVRFTWLRYDMDATREVFTFVCARALKGNSQDDADPRSENARGPFGIFFSLFLAFYIDKTTLPNRQYCPKVFGTCKKKML